MDEIQAAVLRTKLAHLADWIAARRRLCARYEERLSGADVALQRIEPWAEPTWHLCVLLHSERDRLAAELRERGISTGVHYPIPVHRQPGMADVRHRVQGGELPVTDELAATCLSLPIYPELGDDGVDRVAAAVGDVLAGAHV
jgi:dTDP-4-amino-4,6-dideoxygalactose transaminase